MRSPNGSWTSRTEGWLGGSFSASFSPGIRVLGAGRRTEAGISDKEGTYITLKAQCDSI